jgi:hypothetical protein
VIATATTAGTALATIPVVNTGTAKIKIRFTNMATAPGNMNALLTTTAHVENQLTSATAPIRLLGTSAPSGTHLTTPAKPIISYLTPLTLLH